MPNDDKVEADAAKALDKMRQSLEKSISRGKKDRQQIDKLLKEIQKEAKKSS